MFNKVNSWLANAFFSRLGATIEHADAFDWGATKHRGKDAAKRLFIFTEHRFLYSITLHLYALLPCSSIILKLKEALPKRTSLRAHSRNYRNINSNQAWQSRQFLGSCINLAKALRHSVLDTESHAICQTSQNYMTSQNSLNNTLRAAPLPQHNFETERSLALGFFFYKVREYLSRQPIAV